MNVKDQYKQYVLYDPYMRAMKAELKKLSLGIQHVWGVDRAKPDSDYTYQEVFKLDNSENDGKIMKLEVLKTRNRRGSYVHSRNVQALSLF